MTRNSIPNSMHPRFAPRNPWYVSRTYSRPTYEPPSICRFWPETKPACALHRWTQAAAGAETVGGDRRGDVLIGLLDRDAARRRLQAGHEALLHTSDRACRGPPVLWD